MEKAKARLPSSVEILRISQNDSWFRDSGPTVCCLHLCVTWHMRCSVLSQKAPTWDGEDHQQWAHTEVRADISRVKAWCCMRSLWCATAQLLQGSLPAGRWPGWTGPSMLGVGSRGACTVTGGTTTWCVMMGFLVWQWDGSLLSDVVTSIAPVLCTRFIK